jgi:alkylation response protein AidB-like acyl-CoA dehydrogenase
MDRWLALALTAVSADAVGAMRHGLEQVVAYTKERIQYGVPVGSFQAVQHLCAEALVAVEGADSTVKYAAWAVDELEPDEALLAARTAKAYCATTARTVPETIMQVYGGIGQTWEHIAHFVNRRNLVDRQLFGDDAAQQTAIADARLGGR